MIVRFVASNHVPPCTTAATAVRLMIIMASERKRTNALCIVRCLCIVHFRLEVVKLVRGPNFGLHTRTLSRLVHALSRVASARDIQSHVDQRRTVARPDSACH